MPPRLFESYTIDTRLYSSFVAFPLCFRGQTSIRIFGASAAVLCNQSILCKWQTTRVDNCFVEKAVSFAGPQKMYLLFKVLTPPSLLIPFSGSLADVYARFQYRRPDQLTLKKLVIVQPAQLLDHCRITVFMPYWCHFEQCEYIASIILLPFFSSLSLLLL